MYTLLIMAISLVTCGALEAMKNAKDLRWELGDRIKADWVFPYAISNRKEAMLYCYPSGYYINIWDAENENRDEYDLNPCEFYIPQGPNPDDLKRRKISLKQDSVKQLILMATFDQTNDLVRLPSVKCSPQPINLVNKGAYYSYWPFKKLALTETVHLNMGLSFYPGFQYLDKEGKTQVLVSEGKATARRNFTFYNWRSIAISSSIVGVGAVLGVFSLWQLKRKFIG